MLPAVCVMIPEALAVSLAGNRIMTYQIHHSVYKNSENKQGKTVNRVCTSDRRTKVRVSRVGEGYEGKL